MRKVLTFAVAALMAVAIAGASSAASETSWRIQLLADDGAGGGAGVAMSIGVYPTSLDGLDTVAVIQDVPCAFVEPPGDPKNRWVVGVLADDAINVYTRDIKSPASPYTYPKNHKIWDLRVMANVFASALPIRLSFKTQSATATTSNPLPTVGGLPIFFELVMINNRGILGAPTNGTIWNVPIPTVSSAAAFWSIDTALDTNGVAWGNLPLFKTSSPLDAASMRAQGYEMQFRVVPEPSSMLAMGSGLIGLIGVAIRRRRA